MSSERQGPRDEESGSYRIINCFEDVSPEITPADAMDVFKEDPQRVFPFPIDGLDGEDSVELGREYSLRPIFVDSERVTVTSETDDSFSFVSQDDHIRGDDAHLTFTTLRNDEGEMCLMQEATFRKNIFTPILDLGSQFMWKIQTLRLQRALKRRE